MPKLSVPIFAYGFRIFFLAAALAAPLLILRWLGFQLFNFARITPYYDPVTWHAHEMLFGFATAMVAGFLLTAVPNWTGTKALQGLPLVLLIGLWLLGRVLPLLTNGPLVAVTDLAFLPALGLALAPPLIAKRQLKTLIFIPVVGVLWLADVLVHAQILLGRPGLATWGLHLGISFITLLIVIIGGRVIPFFTRMALKDHVIDQKQWPLVEGLAFATTAALPLFDLIPPYFALGLGLVACGIHLVRMSGWWVSGAFRMPILWILYVGYAWIALGFALRGLASLGSMQPSVALHAFTVGGIGIVGVGMMSRVSLGHTGRPITAAPLTVVAYLLMIGAALVRVGGPIFGLPARLMLYGAGGLWVLSFVLFLAVYVPVLMSPRVDGRPG